MRNWLLVLLLCSNCLARAQNSSYLDLDKFAWPNIPVPYYVERVIDARTPGSFQKTTAEYLQSFFSRNFPETGRKPLIIRLNYLALYEVMPADHPIAFCELHLSFIAREDSSYYELFQSAVITEKAGFKVNTHAQNFRDALDQSFIGFFQRLAENKIIAKKLSKAELLDNPLLALDYRALTGEPIPKGIFKTFYDFRDLTPDTSRNFTVNYEEWNPNAPLRALIHLEDSKTKIKDVWGFSNGRNAFVRVGKRYYQLNNENGAYTVYCDRRQLFEKDHSGAVAAGALGGLLGVLVYYAVTAPQEEIIQCTIDFTNGTPAPMNQQSFSGGEVYFYYTSYSKGNHLTLSINGTEHCKIARGNYYRFACTTDDLQLEACLTDDAGQSHCQIIPASLARKIYLCKLRNGVPQLEILSSDLEDSMLGDIDHGKYEESCKD